MSDQPTVSWVEAGTTHSACWRSETGMRPPASIVVADDRITADSAYRMACEGTAMLWRGDFQNARQLLQAMARRADGKQRKSPNADMPQAFHLHRQAQSQRARTLGMLLLPFEADYRIPLRRAPDVSEACREVYGPVSEPFVTSMRELQGLIGAHEWRKKGVSIPELGAHIYPHYGVFSPVRGEYLELVARAPLPSTELAYDIGTGTGVLAALLARRGVQRVVATDLDARALACARDNIARLQLDQQVEVVKADLYPSGRAPLVVCNPPWLPGKPSSTLEQAVYDPDSRMLRGFLAGLQDHLVAGGEGWLILSDLAEHLRLRSREQLLDWIAEAGLEVVDKLDTRPRHPKATDAHDPLHAARCVELTSLWRLRVAGISG